MIDRAVVRAFGGVALDELVIHEAVETVVAAFAVEPQQVIPQQRQLFLLAQGPHIAKARPRMANRVVCTCAKLLLAALEEASNP